MLFYTFCDIFTIKREEGLATHCSLRFMKITKKIISILLSLSIISCIPVSASETPFEYICGDSDRDGVITVIDSTYIQRTLCCGFYDNIMPNEINVMDVSGDGEINIIDATIIKKFLVSKIDTFPALSNNKFVKTGIPQTEEDVISELNLDTASTEDIKTFKKSILKLFNDVRDENNLVRFKYDGKLALAAQKRAEELVEKYSHTRPDGSYYDTIFEEFNLCDFFYCENIASGYGTPSSVTNAWMNSPGHKAAILEKKYRYIGVGYKHVDASESSDGKPHTYWSVLFS